jgi:hypothetical protein
VWLVLVYCYFSSTEPLELDRNRTFDRTTFERTIVVTRVETLYPNSLYNKGTVWIWTMTTRSPFPGMNPYLEQPTFWSEFHNRLIVAMSDSLTLAVQPAYYVAVETRTYFDDDDPNLLVGIPDALVLSATSNPQSSANPNSTMVQSPPVPIRLPMPVEIRERYLEVREVGTEAVVTVIEVLSPKNKRRGKGRTTYERKRQRMLGSQTNLVEIDLLRGGAPMPMSGVEEKTAYRIVVSSAVKRPLADLYPFGLRDSIPNFGLPLKPTDEDVVVNLQEILEGVFSRGSYPVRLDYRQPVPPPRLSPMDQQWVDALLLIW